ncbi:MAG: hypothetical protein Q4C63_05515 [Eubacteriales bacterium]|nr:hypothetical protein [Eubacteriales bacterium]
MQVMEILEILKERARQDEALRGRLLATAGASAPITAFCSIARELGYPLYEMDLIGAGEEFYAEIKRSTNGGGENSPKLEGEDDLYALFMAEIG